MNAQTHSIALSVETITPQIAEKYLSLSGGNRGLKAAKVDGLARDMRSGKFKLNGESVIFSASGTLQDGHHRLTACAKSGVSIESVVVRGVPEAARKTQDTGSSRTVGDHLSLDGYKNSNQMSAIVCVIMSLANGRPRSANPSVQEVYDFIDTHPEIVNSTTFASQKSYPRLASIFGAIHFVATIHGEIEKAEAFRNVFATGIPAYEGCPAHALRERLNRDALRRDTMSLSNTQKVAIAAWNKFRAGKSVRNVVIPQDFKIHGW